MLIIYLFLIFLLYIFLESISLKYNCILSLYKVTDLNIGEFSYSSDKIFYRYQLPNTLDKKMNSDY